jgi:hypothetical protein
VDLLHGGERCRGQPPVDVDKLADRACRRRHDDQSAAAPGQAAAELGGPVPVLTLGLPRAPAGRPAVAGPASRLRGAGVGHHFAHQRHHRALEALATVWIDDAVSPPDAGAADSPIVPDSGKQIVRDRNYSTSHDTS